jgi:flagellar basal body-associated protein FliL
MNQKSKLIAAIITIGLILIAIFNFGLGGMSVPIINNDAQPSENSSTPAIVSSEPVQLFKKETLVVSPSQVFKLNFNVPLQNAPETRIVFEPAHEINVELTNYNKTAVITPKVPFKLGQGYTIFIKSETKLEEEGKTLGQGYDFHFNVINYSGI